jgi:multidrug resistance efflux pump
MSEEKQTTRTEAEPPLTKARSVVNKGQIVVLAVIVFCLSWYLLADRYTPCTTQARIQGYVVGVAPKVAGLVTEVWVANNQDVEKDQKLFQIDTSQYEIALAKARSDLQTAYRQVDAGDAAVEAARANLAAARANEVKAEKDAMRLQRLYDQDPGTISVRRLEVSVATLDQARAAVAAAEAGIEGAIEQMGGQDSEENAYLKAALAAVDKAELDLANTTVRASLPGVVTDLRADVGLYAGTGSPVLTLIAMHDVWINAEFTENNLGHLKPGTPVEIVFDARPGRVFDGRVRSIGLGVGTGQASAPGTLPQITNNRDWLRAAQRFPVMVEFDPSQDPDLGRLLRVGGQATVIAFPQRAGPLNLLGKLYIRLVGAFSYAY